VRMVGFTFQTDGDGVKNGRQGNFGGSGMKFVDGIKVDWEGDGG